MYFNLPEQNNEELEKQRIARERAKQKILADMREHKRIRQEYEIAEQQEAAEEQKKEETKKELEIINLRWEHTEKEIADQRPDFAVIGDTIKLLADVNNGDGNRSLFEVHDLNISYNVDPEQLVADKSSKVDAGATSVEWKVSDPRSKKEADREIDVYFLVKVRDAYSENCEIPIEEAKAFTVRLFINPAVESSKDDTFTLVSEDESYKIVKTIKDDTIKGDDCLTLTYDGIEEGKNYSFIIDPGNEGEPFYFFENLAGSELLKPDEDIYRDDSEE